MNRSVLFSALLLGASISPAAVVPLSHSCDGLSTFADLRIAGFCTAGIFTIKNPIFSGPEGLDSSLILASITDFQNINFGFQNLSLSTGPGETLSFTFGYTIDPPPDIIKGVSGSIEDAGQSSFDDFFAIAAAGDPVDIQYRICAGAGFVNESCAGTLYAFSLAVPDQNENRNFLTLASQLIGGVTFAFPVNTVGVIVDVNLSNGGFIQGGFGSAFPLDPIPDVPEPGTMALAGLGVVLLRVRSRWLRRRSQ